MHIVKNKHILAALDKLAMAKNKSPHARPGDNEGSYWCIVNKSILILQKETNPTKQITDAIRILHNSKNRCPFSAPGDHEKSLEASINATISILCHR